MENQHKMISGYRDLSAGEINEINEIKNAEKAVAGIWHIIRQDLAADPRWIHIAKTHFEEGFSALVRAVAKPESPFDY